jgi:thermitase
MFVRRRTATLVCLASLAAMLAQGPTHAAPRPRVLANDAVPGQALVRFRSGISDATRLTVHARHGAVVLRHIPELSTDLVAVPAREMASYGRERAVAHVEPNYVAHVALHPNDPCFETACTTGSYPFQWNAQWDNAQFGWDAYPGAFYTAAQRTALLSSDPARLVKVAVLDTKIDVSHEDWVPSGGTDADVRHGGMLDLADARDYVAPNRQTGSASYHGTFVAGILAAAAGNGIGVAGMAVTAQVMPVAVVDGTGSADAATLASAIVYAWQKAARVINLSLGLTSDSDTVHNAIRMVTGNVPPGPGVTPPSTGPALVVAAAGNNTGDAPFYPGSYPEVMSVSGTDPTDRHASCSNFNTNVSVSAPADGIVSLRQGSGVMKGTCGTSAATPQVSALAVLAFSQIPTRTAAQVRATIERTADDLGSPGRDEYYGFGRINMERALRYGGPLTAYGVTSSIPPASGGPSSIRASVTSSRPVTKAEYYLDDPGCMGGVGTPMSVSNIAASTYQLSASLDVTSNIVTGPHTLFVRAFDGTTWSPASVGALYVDRVAPALAGVQTNTITVPATSTPLTVDFTIIDDYSSRFVAALDIAPAAGPNAGKPVYNGILNGLSAGPQRWSWVPGPDVLPGVYRGTLAVADEAFNVHRVVLPGTIVVV